LDWTLDFRHDAAIRRIIRHVILLSGTLAVWFLLWFLIWSYLTFGQRWWIRIVNCFLRQLLLSFWLVTATRRRRGFGAFLLFGKTRILYTHTHTHSHTHKGKNKQTNTQHCKLTSSLNSEESSELMAFLFFPIVFVMAGCIREEFVRDGDKSVSTTIAAEL